MVVGFLEGLVFDDNFQDGVDMNVRNRLFACFGKQVTAVLLVVHEEVFGQDPEGIHHPDRTEVLLEISIP